MKLRRAHAVVIALVLAAAVTVLIANDPGGRASARRASVEASRPPDILNPATKAPPPAAKFSDGSSLLAGNEGGRTSLFSSSGSPARFRDLYPAQSRAVIDPNVRGGNSWALLIGINDYAGGTRDNVGSYQDARDLRKHLLSLGWRGDHIVLMANRSATASMILQGIRWLASKTDGSSVVAFNYSGHEKPQTFGGTRHIMLHASDNRLVADTTIARELGRVRAADMWINLAVCRAGGFNDPGLVKAGRVVTFSSPESELSYEDPVVDHSVFGWNIVIEAMVQGLGDYNRDGNITVEEAFKYARPRTIERTGGRQHPFMTDKQSGAMSLIPPAPAPAPAAPPPSEEGSGASGCVVICSEQAAYWKD